jgi:predicted Zn-dependent protease with MMP-like domain
MDFSPEAFEQLVADALDMLPDEFKTKLNNVDIVIAPEPTMDQVRKMQLRHGTVLFGLYEGVPQTKRDNGYTMVLPDKITIFRAPIVALMQTPEAIKAQVRKTVLHEIGHHFGMSDAQLRKLKY